MQISRVHPTKNLLNFLDDVSIKVPQRNRTDHIILYLLNVTSRMSHGKFLSPEKCYISCHISKQKMSQSSEIAATIGELVSTEGTQEGEEYLPSNSHQTAATPHGEP